MTPMILEMFIFLDVKKTHHIYHDRMFFLRNAPYGVLIVPNSVILILFAR